MPQERIYGVVSGIITDVDNTPGYWQAKVELPSLNQDTSAWARIAVPMGGAGRGFQFMPEIDDECLVAFEHGDVNSPYIVGFLWNGQDKSPGTDANVRTIQTVSGHVIELDDTQGSEKITIKFKGGDPSITMDQTTLKIAFDGSTSIELSPTGVKVKGTMIELN